MQRLSRKMHTVAILVSVLAGTLIPSSLARAKTQSLCVNPGGTAGCEATIGAAVAKITEKTVTITVAAGTYDDNVSINTGIKPKKLTLTITGTSGASSTVIDGMAAGAVFTIGSKAKVTLIGLTITNGTGGSAQGETGGGGILATGATLRISACAVDHNKAALGAGIYAVDGNLTVTSSSITGNLGEASHVSEGGGVYFSSSSSSKSHRLTIDSSTIDSNSATFGGGVLLSASGPPIKLSATIIDSAISNNTSATNAFGPGSGAGLDIGFARLTMTNSTISGNNASGTTGTGGAIQTFAAAVALNNVTIANNSAGSIGGGINANINDQSLSSATRSSRTTMRQ
jgi:hypothetical protein